MPLIINKSKQPKYLDVKLKEPALSREHSIVNVYEPMVVNGFVKFAKNIITQQNRNKLLKGMSEIIAGTGTIDSTINSLPWFSVGDQLSEKMWNAFIQPFKKSLIETMVNAGNEEMKYLKIPIKVSKIEVPMNYYSSKWIEEESTRLVVEISNEQRQLLKELISKRFISGNLRPEKILDEIGDMVGLTSREAMAVDRRRATLIDSGLSQNFIDKMVKSYANKLLIKRGERIARTETIRAYNHGLMGSWVEAQNNGYLKKEIEKEWVEITLSSRTCEICRGLAGQRARLSDNFVSPDIGSVQSPPAHPQCRCTMIIVDPYDEEEEKNNAFE